MRSHSIVLTLEQAEEPEGEYDFERSKFFGSPVFPLSVVKKEVNFDWIFLAQINMEDIEYYDVDKMLPHKGYMYFFLDDKNREIHIIYTSKDVTQVVIDYNKKFEKKAFETPYYITYETKEEVIVDDEIKFSYQDGMKLLGFPYDSIKKGLVSDDDVLLLQIDPLSAIDFPYLGGANNMGYVFINKDDLKAKKFDKVKFIITKGA